MPADGYKRGAQADKARQVEAAIERGSPALSRSSSATAKRAPAVLLALLRKRLTMACGACDGEGVDSAGKKCRACKGKGLVGDVEAVEACEAAYEHGLSPDDQRAALVALLIRIDGDKAAGELTAAEATRLTLQTHELIAKLGQVEREAPGVPGKIQIMFQLPAEAVLPDPMGDRLLVDNASAQAG